MKCPNCAVTNGKTNKYCRECGTRLDVLAAAHDSPETQSDEVGLGEELFRVIELFESGDLDAALAKGVELAEANKGSASAHSIVALVYERKAEQELAEGNAERFQNFLRLAIDHYERLIDLNPDSAADREKLAALRLKYTGTPAPPTEERISFRQVIQAVPARVWAAFGAFMVVLFLMIFLAPPSPTKPQPTARAERERTPRVAVTPRAPADPGLKVYTFSQNAPSAQPPAAPAAPPPSVNLPKPRINLPEVRPAAVPKIDQDITLTAEPKATPKKPDAEPAKPAARNEPADPTGASVLAHAIRLHDQGRNSEAIGAAHQAVVLYQKDLDAGKNTEAASRGIKNAQKLISVWQESVDEVADM